MRQKKRMLSGLLAAVFLFVAVVVLAPGAAAAEAPEDEIFLEETQPDAPGGTTTPEEEPALDGDEATVGEGVPDTEDAGSVAEEDTMDDSTPTENEAPGENDALSPGEETSPSIGFGLFATADAADESFPEGAVVCATVEELETAFAADVGGDIYLSASLEYPWGDWQLTATKATTVHMGRHSIRLEGDPWNFYSADTELTVDGPVTFVGSETLFEVCGGGNLRFAGGQVVLRAEGPNACALSGSGYANTFWSDSATIYVSGENATGIESSGWGLNIYCYFIYASGGAVPVRYADRLEAVFCWLVNEDDGPIGVYAGEDGGGTAISFSSVMQPVQEDIIAPRVLSATAGWHYNPYVFVGDADFDINEYMPGDLDHYLVQYENLPEYMEQQIADEIMLEVPVSWDLSQLQAFDVNVAGTYEAVGTAKFPFAVEGLTFPALTQQVMVVRPDQAWLTAGGIYGDGDGGFFAQLDLMASIEGEESIRLWCWEKTEDGWLGPVDKMALGEAEVWNDEWWPSISVTNVAPETVYRFQLEVIGGPMAGLSNYREVYVNHDGGGDRDLGDRDPGDWEGGGEDDEQQGENDGEIDDGGATEEGPADSPPGDASPGGTTGGTSGDTTGGTSADGTGGGETEVPTAQGTTTSPSSAAGRTDPQAEEVVPQGEAFDQQHLQDLILANPQQVTLFVGDVRVTMGAAALQQALGDAENLYIDSQAEQGLVRLEIWADGTQITQIEGGVTVSFPYPGGDAEGVFYLELDGMKIPATYSDGMLTATVEMLGAYTVLFEATSIPEVIAPPTPLGTMEVSQPEESVRVASYVLPICLLLGAAAMATMLAVRRRRASS